MDVDFRSNQLPVAPQGDFLYEQKVTKEPFRRRGLRFPRLLKTSTLEPPKRNRARFPFDSLQGMAKLQQTSVFFCAKFVFAKIVAGNVKHCATLRGFQKGDRNPTSVVAGEGSQGEGESKHPLPVRVFGDFLHGEKVTPRSDQQ